MDLRQPFFDEILKIAKKDKDILVLICDLGYSFYEKFEKELPNQIINMGIAEQNAIGVAAGLARAGKKPYVYSGSIFLSSRANEFIRDDVAYANLNVKLIGTGASGFLGFTHNWMGKENDLDLIKNMPNITHCNPIKRETLKKALLSNKPLYIRI